MEYTCPCCGEAKPEHRFFPSKTKPGRAQRPRKCRDCFNADERARVAAGPKRVKTPEARLKVRVNKYGLTPEAYEQMKQDAQGRCAICEQVKDLCIDHCHTTNKVRGLLCNSCNRGVGFFFDNQGWLRKAADYVQENQL